MYDVRFAVGSSVICKWRFTLIQSNASTTQLGNACEHLCADDNLQVVFLHLHQQPPHIPVSQPQQLAAPTPIVRKTSPTMLATPSPSTNPLAMMMMRISVPGGACVRARCRRYHSSTIPPIRRLSENDGTFKKPMAKATPEGIQYAHGDPRNVARLFRAETMTAAPANAAMNTPTWEGSSPPPAYLSVTNNTTVKRTKQTCQTKPHRCGWSGELLPRYRVRIRVQAVCSGRYNDRDSGADKLSVELSARRGM